MMLYSNKLTSGVTRIFIIAVGIISFFSPNANAENSSVVVNVTANIIYGGCTLEPNSKQQIIALGKFNGGQYLIGETGPNQEVSIKFTACSDTPAVKVTLMPNYDFNATYTGVLTLSPQSSAEGVGVEVLNSKLQAVDFSREVSLTEDISGTSAELILFARIKKVANQVIAGTVETGMTYSVEYM